MTNSKMVGMLVVAFLAGSFIASPELRAYASTIANDVICNGCVGTSDMAGNAVTSVKIKDGEVKTDDIAVSAVGSARIKDNDVKAQDLAPDSVGASELQGVTKLLYSECAVTSGQGIPANGFLVIDCTTSGVDSDDTALVTLNNSNGCLHASAVNAETNNVEFQMFSDCAFSVPAVAKVAIVVFDK